MVQISVVFQCGNDAFAEHAGMEAARIFRNLANAAEPLTDLRNLDDAVIHDANGNTIGRVLVIGRR